MATHGAFLCATGLALTFSPRLLEAAAQPFVKARVPHVNPVTAAALGPIPIGLGVCLLLAARSGDPLGRISTYTVWARVAVGALVAWAVANRILGPAILVLALEPIIGGLVAASAGMSKWHGATRMTTRSFVLLAFGAYCIFIALSLSMSPQLWVQFQTFMAKTASVGKIPLDHAVTTIVAAPTLATGIICVLAALADDAEWSRAASIGLAVAPAFWTVFLVTGRLPGMILPFAAVSAAASASLLALTRRIAPRGSSSSSSSSWSSQARRPAPVATGGANKHD